MNSKVIAFRPNEKEQGIIEQFMKDKGIKTPTQAMKQAIKLLSLNQHRLEKTPKVETRYLAESMKSELPYALQQELDRFLRGQGIDRKGNVTCPTIEAILGLNPNSKIKLHIHNPWPWKKGVDRLPTQAKCRLFKRKDGKYLIYLAKNLCEDSQFPFQKFEQDPRKEGVSSIKLQVRFEIGKKRLIIEPLEEKEAP